MSTDTELELVADYACETGEGPLWHPFEQKLYWTDIPTGRLFRLDPTTGQHEQIYQGRPVGGFTIQQDGALLLFLDRGSVALWREGELTEILPEIAAERESRFNDVIADPRGRVFCGTMPGPDGPGRLYRLDLDRTLHLLLEGVLCSNGMAFTPDGKGFYYTDSFRHAISLFDYDAGTGSLSNRRVFAQFTEADGFPDGSTVDAEGHVWSAFWDGGCVARLNPDGSVERKIHLPVPKVSSLTFAGPNCSDLYITTAGGNVRELDGPQAGSLYRVRNQGKGVPEFLSNIR